MWLWLANYSQQIINNCKPPIGMVKHYSDGENNAISSA